MFKQESNPLYRAFFSEENAAEVQSGIRDSVRQTTGVTIGQQNPADLFAIMGSVYSVNITNPYGNIPQQVQNMNRITVTKCAEQVVSGIRSYQMYLKDISAQPVPPAMPRSTTSYGKKTGEMRTGL